MVGGWEKYSKMLTYLGKLQKTQAFLYTAFSYSVETISKNFKLPTKFSNQNFKNNEEI